MATPYSHTGTIANANREREYGIHAEDEGGAAGNLKPAHSCLKMDKGLSSFWSSISLIKLVAKSGALFNLEST